MDELPVRTHGGALAALRESIQAVQKALLRQPSLPPEQLLARLHEWQQLTAELANEEANRRRLATLYQVSRAINSSLNLTETLDLVMGSLIELTGAERGCLMLLDDEGRLTIRAARQFDHHTVAAADLAISHTVVQEAIRQGGSVLTTNAQHDPRFSAQESVVAYQLRSIVCVPLHARQQVIGAIYLDNRIREGVFSEADLPMLKAFASQAAVAIENARLHTMTDQALSERLEELTILQQMDRELNATLEFGRVLDLTLRWALRATHAEEGTISVRDESGAFQPVAHAGGQRPPKTGRKSAQPPPDSTGPIVLDGKRLLVPIRYEQRLIGLLDLQRNGGGTFRPADIQLASRLADHAAAAIQNARLYDAVRQANLAKSEFVSQVAHELRAPMTSIRGYADMLQQGIVGPLTSQQEQFIRTIRSNIERMQALVSDLQDTSRIEVGQMRVEPCPIRLTDALVEALQATRPQMNARTHRLTVEIPAELPLLRADPTRLTQILVNLLSNACQYTPPGGQITVRAWQENGRVYCSVADTGIGISPGDQARLFTRFFRADDPNVRAVPGTGLGLYIVKKLLELQDGNITIHSRLGEGTTFTFDLPAT